MKQILYSPLEQFIIYPVLQIFTFNLDFSTSNFTLIFFFLTLVLFFIFKKMNFLERSFMNRDLFNEGIFFNPLNYIYNITISVASDLIGKNKYFFIFLPSILAAHSIVLFFNVLGLLPHAMTISSHFIAAFSVSFFYFSLLNLFAIIKHKEKISLIFLPGNLSLTLLILLVPIEFLSYFFRPISLAIRLFANMMAGHILLKVIYGFMLTFYASFDIFTILGVLSNVCFVLLGLLETAVAAIQAIIFIVLLCVYLRELIDLG